MSGASARFRERNVRFVRRAFKVARVGKSSVALTETFTTGDEALIAECESVIVGWDQRNATTKPLSPDEAERLEAAATT